MSHVLLLISPHHLQHLLLLSCELLPSAVGLWPGAAIRMLVWPGVGMLSAGVMVSTGDAF